MNTPNFDCCTVIAVNYLPQALVLEDSIRRNFPGMQLHILIVDSTDDVGGLFKFAHIYKCQDLVSYREEISWMKNYYDLFEFCTAIKPTFLKFLLENRKRKLVFLDPDTEVFSTFDPWRDAGCESDIILTPHRLTPLSKSPEYGEEISFLRYGVFNLGFIAVGQNSGSFLDWWESRLLLYSSRYFLDVNYTDQKWIDLAPCWFDISVIRHKGYNLAPWNIDERPIVLELVDGCESHMIEKSKLVFVHYSQMSSLLSKGINPNYWKNNHEGNRLYPNSVQLVSNLTSKYSLKLVAASGKVDKFQPGREKWPIRSHFQRKLMRRKYRKYRESHGSDQHFPPTQNWLLRALAPLIIIGERVYLLNAIAYYLTLDVKRIRKKILPKQR